MIALRLVGISVVSVWYVFGWFGVLRLKRRGNAYMQKLHDSGFGNLTASQISTLKIHGVD